MDSVQLIPSTPQCTMELTKGKAWIRGTFRLANEYRKGELVYIAPGADFSIQSTDDLGANYNIENWKSGLASGSLYAFRALQIPRQILVVADMAGNLAADDMQAVAACAAMSVARLTGRSLANVVPDGWIAQEKAIQPPIARLGA
jgi:hypothetical protein